LFLAWLNIVRDWEKFPAREQVLVINNTFHQVGLHFLARVAGWRSLKIAGTFFHHARQGFKKHIVNAMEWLHAFLATRVMIISPSGWEYVPKRFHQKTKYFIPNFLYDTPLQTLPKMNSIEAKPNSAICLSRLEPEKGLADLIKAWNTTDPEWQLTIYGDGSQKKYLLDLIKNLGLSDRVTIHDPVTHAEVFSSLSPYHVFILTSPSEGLGMCYLEALYMKVPCIGLRVAGVKDTLAEGRGILLEPVSWMTHLNGALQKATALNNSLEWHQKIETYFTTIILPTINPGTGVWFEK
jgi:glycosyltransferase involved in cell wall biosynthesis